MDNDRYFMLETIREFALEEQDRDLALAHGEYYLQRLHRDERVVRGPRMAEFLAWYRAETENTWAAVDAFVAAGRRDDAWELTRLLSIYWLTAGEFGGQSCGSVANCGVT